MWKGQKTFCDNTKKSDWPLSEQLLQYWNCCTIYITKQLAVKKQQQLPFTYVSKHIPVCNFFHKTFTLDKYLYIYLRAVWVHAYATAAHQAATICFCAVPVWQPDRTILVMLFKHLTRPQHHHHHTHAHTYRHRPQQHYFSPMAACLAARTWWAVIVSLFRHTSKGAECVHGRN